MTIYEAQNDKYLLKIAQDEDAENPRTAWDNVGTMVCWHRRYNLGDDHHFTDPQDFHREIHERNALILPLFLYDHSVLVMSTSSFVGRTPHAEWDSGQVGWIYVLKTAIRQEWGVKRISPKLREHIYHILESEVAVYSDYLRGNVYGFILEEKTACDCDGGCYQSP